MTTDDYLREVAFQLRDLPWKQRRELVAEIRQHLSELPAATDLWSHLGPPSRYVAELRAAAGLERRRGLVAFVRARRPRNVVLTTVLTILLLTALGLAIGAIVWVDGYQPLECVCSEVEPDGAKPSPGQAGDTVFFRKGRPFRYGIWIVNDGGYAVRVLGVPRGVTDFFTGHLFVSKDPNHSVEPLERFHPFDLRPHASQWLVFKGVYACTTGMAGPGVGPKNSGYGAIVHDSFPVRYKFHWRTATAEIPLADPLEISFAKEGCPSKP